MQTTFGLHQHRSSRSPAAPIHLPEGVRTLPELLREAGWFCFNHGKDDYNFVYDRAALYDGEFKGTTNGAKPKRGFYGASGKRIRWTEREEGQPFFGQIQLRGGKWWGALRDGKKEVEDPTDPAEIEVPPYYPDLPSIRQAFAWHHDTARITDDEVGALLGELERDGLLKETVVFFFSDHGMNNSLRHKQFCYEGGLHVPLIARVPEKWRRASPGEARNGLVSLLDVTATTLAFAGLERPEWYEGRDLFSREATESPRPMVFSARDRCDYTIDCIRSVRDERYRYIRNLLPDRPWMQPQYRDNWPMVRELRVLTAAEEARRPARWVLPRRAPRRGALRPPGRSAPDTKPGGRSRAPRGAGVPARSDRRLAGEGRRAQAGVGSGAARDPRTLGGQVREHRVRGVASLSLHGSHPDRRARQELRKLHRARTPRPPRSRGIPLRVPGAERRGQVDDHPRAARPLASQRRTGLHPRP